MSTVNFSPRRRCRRLYKERRLFWVERTSITGREMGRGRLRHAIFLHYSIAFGGDGNDRLTEESASFGQLAARHIHSTAFIFRNMPLGYALFVARRRNDMISPLRLGCHCRDCFARCAIAIGGDGRGTALSYRGRQAVSEPQSTEGAATHGASGNEPIDMMIFWLSTRESYAPESHAEPRRDVKAGPLYLFAA